MTDRAVIQAEFEDVKRVKTRKCWQLIFEVPEERYDDAMEALGGSPRTGESRPVAIALLKPTASTEAPTETTRPKGGAICKRAVMLCKQPAFQNWLWEGHEPWNWDGKVNGHNLEERMTDIVRRLCGIESRAELDHDPDAARIFKRMEQDFYASQRGQTDEALAVQARRGR